MRYFFRVLIILLKGIIPRFASVISMVWLVSAVSFPSFRLFRFARFARFARFSRFVSVVSLVSFRSFRSFRSLRFGGFVSLFRVLVHAFPKALDQFLLRKFLLDQFLLVCMLQESLLLWPRVLHCRYIIYLVSDYVATGEFLENWLSKQGKFV